MYTIADKTGETRLIVQSSDGSRFLASQRLHNLRVPNYTGDVMKIREVEISEDGDFIAIIMEDGATHYIDADCVADLAEIGSKMP
jgi:hypothetical protein